MRFRLIGVSEISSRTPRLLSESALFLFWPGLSVLFTLAIQGLMLYFET